MIDLSDASSRSFGAVATAIALVGLPSVGAAQQAPADAPPTVSTVPAGTMSRKTPYRIVLDQISGGAVVYNQRGTVIDRWNRDDGTAPLANIPFNRPVSLVVFNANPLLYDYSVQAAVIGQEEVKTCANAGAKFLGAGLVLSSAAVLGGSVTGFGPPSSTAGFLDIDAALSSQLSTRGAAQLTPQLLEQELERIRAEVNGFVEFTTQFNDLAGSVDDSLAYFAAMGEAVPLDSILGSFQASLDALIPGLSSPARIPLLLERRAAAAAQAVGTLRDMASSIATNNYTGSPSDFTAREVVQLNARVEAGARRLQSTYPALQRAALLVARTKSQTTKTFTISESGGAVRRLVITSKGNGQYPEVLRLHDGDMEVFTRPRAGWVCQLTVGMSSLQPVPNYAFDASGTLLDNSAGDDRRVAATLMLNVAPPGVHFLGLGLGLGIGTNSAPDLYLGGSLLLFSPVSLSVGWVWQRTPQLPSGFTVGDVPLNPDPLELEQLNYQYQSTVFFGLGIQL
jgi:hypothetical protein